MIDIRVLAKIDAGSLASVITSYTTSKRYEVHHQEADGQTIFALRLIELDAPFTKSYDHLDDETLGRYRAVLPDNLSFGAYDGERLVGLVIAEPHHWNGSAWVWDFHVADAYRGQGIGARLMDALAEKAKADGLRVIVCETQTANVPAIRFYRKVGFTLDGIDLSYYTNEDVARGDVAVFMKRKL